MRRLSLVIAVLVVAGCGSDSEEPEGSGAGADLRVVIRPEGARGPERVRRIRCETLGRDADERICRALADVAREDLAPVPPRTACTQVYGGPATARVTGELRGRPVSARFELTNGCEIARWERNSALLGQPPGRAVPTPPNAGE